MLEIMIGTFVLMAVLAIVIIVLRDSRTRALKDVARSLRFSFADQEDSSFMALVGNLELFSQGDSQRASNLMRGRMDGIDVCIVDFDFSFDRGGEDSPYVKQTVVVFRSPDLRLPSFTLRPENIFHKIGSALGYRDIDIDRHPAFSKQYSLHGLDKLSIRKSFTDSVLTYYESHKGMSTEGEGEVLVFYRARRRISPRNIRPFLYEGLSVVKRFEDRSATPT